eukprot:g44262.t1
MRKAKIVHKHFHGPRVKQGWKHLRSGSQISMFDTCSVLRHKSGLQDLPGPGWGGPNTPLYAESLSDKTARLFSWGGTGAAARRQDIWCVLPQQA